MPILQNPNATIRDTALSIHNRAGGGLRAANWHYMNYGENGEELYDMEKDPHQYVNLVKNPEYAEILKHARKTYAERIAAAEQSETKKKKKKRAKGAKRSPKTTSEDNQ